MRAAPPWVRPVLLSLLVAGGCARQRYSSDGAVPYDGYDPAAHTRGGSFAPRRYYPPPGPSRDPWGPYIQEAASRFRVPEQWVRAVMHQESGGREQAVSPVGAMGLMQVMPATYEGLRNRHRLGDDPYDPHNNILAGTAYIREMYDRFGSPGFLAAYNAGPDRLTSYLAGTSELPNETVNYVASITPHLGGAVALSGPLATYASAGAVVGAPTVDSLASGCDVNAAYDPERPCAPLERAASAPAPVQRVAAVAAPMPVQRFAAVAAPASGGCDPDAAFDSGRACAAGAAETGGTVSALYQPRVAAPAAMPAFMRPPGLDARAAPGAWAIQVGAFANAGLARAVAEGARAEAVEQLRAATVALPAIGSPGAPVLYRARLINLSAADAAAACRRLNQRQLPCIVVQPAGA